MNCWKENGDRYLLFGDVPEFVPGTSMVMAARLRCVRTLTSSLHTMTQR